MSMGAAGILAEWAAIRYFGSHPAQIRISAPTEPAFGPFRATGSMESWEHPVALWE